MTGGGTTTSFMYDGDGNRVANAINGVTTSYIDNYFEWTGSTTNIVKYYFACPR